MNWFQHGMKNKITSTSTNISGNSRNKDWHHRMLTPHEQFWVGEILRCFGESICRTLHQVATLITY